MPRKDQVVELVERQGPVRRGDVAEHLGIDDSYAGALLSEMAKEEPPRLQRVVEDGEVIEGLYDLPERVDSEEKNETDSLTRSLDGDTIRVPLLTMRVNAGTGEPLWDEEVEGYVHYDKNQIRRETGADPNRIAYFPIAGNSMVPTLRPGDRALVVRYDGEPLQDGSIYVFRNRRRGTIVKRVYWEDSTTLRLQSDNDEGPTISIDFEADGGDWTVLGRVLRVEKHL